MAAVAYWILQKTIVASQGDNSLLRKALGKDWKGKSSPVVYAAAMLTAFWSPPLAQGLYVLVALVWLIPDSRIEKALATKGSHSG
jgi:hypothetical protein